MHVNIVRAATAATAALRPTCVTLYSRRKQGKQIQIITLNLFCNAFFSLHYCLLQILSPIYIVTPFLFSLPSFICCVCVCVCVEGGMVGGGQRCSNIFS